MLTRLHSNPALRLAKRMVAKRSVFERSATATKNSSVLTDKDWQTNLPSFSATIFRTAPYLGLVGAETKTAPVRGSSDSKLVALPARVKHRQQKAEVSPPHRHSHASTDARQNSQSIADQVPSWLLRILQQHHAEIYVDTYARSLRTARTGTRTSLLRAVRTEGAGQLAPGQATTVRTPYTHRPRACCTYRVPWHPRLRWASSAAGGTVTRRGTGRCRSACTKKPSTVSAASSYQRTSCASCCARCTQGRVSRPAASSCASSRSTTTGSRTPSRSTRRDRPPHTSAARPLHQGDVSRLEEVGEALRGWVRLCICDNHSVTLRPLDATLRNAPFYGAPIFMKTQHQNHTADLENPKHD